MFIWTRGAVRAVEIGQPTPLLNLVAGEFAPAVAGLWPAPHARFLTAPAERRHLVCIALAGGARDELPVDALLERALRSAIRLAIPDAPAGLARALGRLGETAWTGDDYRALLVQLRHPRSAKIWRHASEIPAETVRAYAQLPAPMLCRRGGPLDISPHGASALAESLAAISARDPAKLDQIVARWSQAADAAALFEHARRDLLPPFPPAALDGGPRLRRLASIADLEDVAERYQNCVRGYDHAAARGDILLYEWLGEPGAIVEISRDVLFGWTLTEAKLANNAPVRDPLRGEIIAELRARSVHVGRSYWDLSRALNDARQSDFRLQPLDQVVGELFGD